MKFLETELKDAFIVELDKIEDDRGFFARAWCKEEFEKRGLFGVMVQANIAYNNKRGILRGLHRQITPFEEIKIVRCTRGSIYDVIVDLRHDSPTFQQWIGIELTSDNHRMLYVPVGFGHGYLTLEDNTEVFYQVSQAYSGAYERGLRWNDPAFGIEWPDPGTDYLISDKDRNWPDFT
jgi:dTDP-4-dehydrorhamnose 3,5-epimerase